MWQWGLRRDGKKEVLGLWPGKNEPSAFWMSVLTDMKARGTEDILITATDNLNGFTDTIKSVFPPDMRGAPDTQCVPLCRLEGQKGFHR